MLNKKLFTAMVVSAVLMGAAAPAAFAATTVSVDGNGNRSNSTVKVTNSKSAVVKQTNNSNVNTTVNSKANTGKNKVKGNVGGSSSVSTGVATSTVNVGVGGSTNTATVESCGCDEDVLVVVADNGARSDNTVKVSNNSWFGSFQTNVSNIVTSVTSKANTGKNEVKNNVGDSSSVETEAAHSTVNVGVTGSTNTL